MPRTDHVLMSWGKSGRTWLRLMLSRFYQLAYGIPEGRMLEFDNLHRLDPAIPRLFFTHGNYLRDYTGNWKTKQRLLRQAHPDAGARPARHRGLAILPMEIPHAAGEEAAERLSAARRRAVDVRFRA